MPGTSVTPFRSNLPVPNPTRYLNILSAGALAVPTALGVAATMLGGGWFLAVLGVIVGCLGALSPRVAQQWERAVVLRLGRYKALEGPGPFWIIPFVDSVPTWIDQRTITSSFAAEETLTSDAVPVNVDAVLFWTVYDAEKAALEVQDYRQAVSWAAQTALRDIIGRTSLTDLLRGRERIEEELKALIDVRSTPWGVSVHSVEMRDVVIPTSLQDAMSREAQASREKQARIILGEAEVEIAKMFQSAAEAYRDNPVAMQLRAMNILYEGLKQKGGMMVVPSSIVDSMGPHGVLSMAALARSQEGQMESSRASEERRGRAEEEGREGEVVSLPPVVHPGNG